jgi:hypothetical protein
MHDNPSRPPALLEPLESRRLLATFTVDSTLDVVNPNDGVTTLREAVAQANAAGSNDVIAFSSLFDTKQTIDLTGGELVVSDDLTLSPPATGLRIDAAFNSRHFRINGPTSLTLERMELVNGFAGVASDGRGNDGGSIYAAAFGEPGPNGVGSTLTLDGSRLANNRAADGGAIRMPGDVVVIESTIELNNASEPATAPAGEIAVGGAIFILPGGSLSTSGGTILNNEAGGPGSQGGGAYVWNRARFENFSIEGNSADFGGGLFLVDGSTGVAAIDPDISAAMAGGGGGATRSPIAPASLDLIRTRVDSNVARIGGGFFAVDAAANLVQARIIDNRAVGIDASGGGFVLQGGNGTALFIDRSEISENSAINPNGLSFGGGFSVIASPDAPLPGSAADDVAVPVTVVNSIVSQNAAGTRGGIDLTAAGRTTDAFGNPLTGADRGAAEVDALFIHATITENTATDPNGTGGLTAQATVANLDLAEVAFANSIVSGNVSGDADVSRPVGDTGAVDAAIGSFGGNLLGIGLTPATPSGGDVFSDTPNLSPLDAYGGRTRTQPPLSTSPAIDIGTNALAVDPGFNNRLGGGDDQPLSFDQRDNPFARIIGGLADAGSTEFDSTNDIINPTVVATAFEFEQQLAVIFEFSEDVGPSVDVLDLRLRDVDTNIFLPIVGATVIYDSLARTATFALDAVQTPPGNYEATLNNAGIIDAAENALEGAPAVNFFWLPGDADRNRTVNLADFGALRANFGRADDPLFSEADFNYDGVVNLADFGILRANFGDTVPPPMAAAPSLFFGGMTRRGVASGIFAR